MELTRYNSFEYFMSDVLDAAETIETFKLIFEIKDNAVIELIKKMLNEGWKSFSMVAFLLALGVVPFAAALGALAVTGVGLVVIAIFGAFAVSAMWILYHNRKLPLGLKKVGDKYKPIYERILIEYKTDNLALKKQVDLLLKKAIIDLISIGKNEF